jgi:hypothetical protein
VSDTDLRQLSFVTQVQQLVHSQYRRRARPPNCRAGERDGIKRAPAKRVSTRVAAAVDMRGCGSLRL